MEDDIIWDYVKIGVIILSALSPILCISISGEFLGSLSSYWKTEAQPIFILSNAAVSYFFFSLKEWRIPSIMLLLTTAFSLDFFETLHNILAIGFFIASLYSLYANKRSIKYVIPYIASLFFLLYSLLCFEILAIYILCAYHLETIITKIRILKQRNGKDN